MNFGIIGTGTIATIHAQAINAIKGSTLKGVYNRSLKSAQKLAHEYNTQAYSSLDALLTDPTIDIVTIATPSGAHFDSAMAAINIGKHVLVEKPLEITTERIDEMISAAQTKGVVLAGILNRRFHPAMDAAQKALSQGRLGQMTSASTYMKWYRDQEYYDSAAWRGTWDLDGGGALMNQGIHAIDSLIYLAGPVKSLQANTACLAHDGIEVEDIATVILEFENGARGVIEGNTCSWSSTGHPARIQLTGTEGSIFIADESLEAWDFKTSDPDDVQLLEQLSPKSITAQGANDPKAIQYIQHQRNFEEVIAAIKENRPPSTNAIESRKSVALIQAIYHSAQNNGLKVHL